MQLDIAEIALGSLRRGCQVSLGRASGKVQSPAICLLTHEQPVQKGWIIARMQSRRLGSSPGVTMFSSQMVFFLSSCCSEIAYLLANF